MFNNLRTANRTATRVKIWDSWSKELHTGMQGTFHVVSASSAWG